MTKKTAVLITDRIFNRMYLVTIIGFLQDFKDTYNACNIHERTEMSLFKHTLTVSLNLSSRRVLHYPPKRPKHGNGTWRRIPLFSTIFWSDTNLTTTLPSLTPIFARLMKMPWWQLTTPNNHGGERWVAAECIPKRRSTGFSSKASTKRSFERFTNGGPIHHQPCLRS